MITASDIAWELPERQVPPTSSPDDLIVDLLIEAQSYRSFTQQALHQLHQVMLERDLLRDQMRLARSRLREIPA